MKTTITLALAFISMTGRSTVYGPPIDAHIGQDNSLYCSTAGRPLRYSESGVFVALDASEYTSGRVKCGDFLLVYLDGKTLLARAWDAGRLYDAGLGIIVDVPYKHHDKNSRAHVVNLSALKRWQLEHKQWPVPKGAR
ncbi:MAG: hypothetical protein ACYTEQ_29825 [Planctomycetota bacterium]